MYSTATLSGRPEMSGNVRRISVKTLDKGWDWSCFSGFKRYEKSGYRDPTKVLLGAPSAA